MKEKYGKQCGEKTMGNNQSNVASRMGALMKVLQNKQGVGLKTVRPRKNWEKLWWKKLNFDTKNTKILMKKSKNLCKNVELLV